MCDSGRSAVIILSIILVSLISGCNKQPVSPVESSTGIHLMSKLRASGNAITLAVRDPFVYLGFDSGVDIINADNPAQPYIISSLGNINYPMNITLDGNYAYIASLGSGLQVFDISDPYNPVLAGRLNIPDTCRHTAIEGHYAYLADNNLRLINVEDPSQPYHCGSYYTNGIIEDVYMYGGYCLIKINGQGLRFIDMSDPIRPRQVGDLIRAFQSSQILLNQNVLYVTDIFAGGLKRYDVSNPENPELLSTYTDTTFRPYFMDFDNGRIVAINIDYSIKIIDYPDSIIQDPITSYNIEADQVRGMVAVDNYIYIADHNLGLMIYKYSE
jgi:hypothetical protein